MEEEIYRRNLLEGLLCVHGKQVQNAWASLQILLEYGEKRLDIKTESDFFLLFHHPIFILISR